MRNCCCTQKFTDPAERRIRIMCVYRHYTGARVGALFSLKERNKKYTDERIYKYKRIYKYILQPFKCR